MKADGPNPFVDPTELLHFVEDSERQFRADLEKQRSETLTPRLACHDASVRRISSLLTDGESDRVAMLKTLQAVLQAPAHAQYWWRND